MDIQYNHHNSEHYQKRTIAVALPNAIDFSEQIENPKREITLSVGTAFCSPKDNYCRKTGREVSSSRMLPVTFRLTLIHFVGDDVYFSLQTPTFPLQRELKLKMSPKSSRLHLIEAY